MDNMCGLVGVAGDLAFKDEGFLKRLLILDYFRGTDSTGVAFVDSSSDRDFNIVKMATHPINLFSNKQFEKHLNGMKSVAFIGHNRAATVGKVNDLSAHPYSRGEIVGAHNGTLSLSDWKKLETMLEYDTQTDSEAIIHAIEEFGIEETITGLNKGATSQTGAWALTWYDRYTDEMCFLRNSHRPLWLCFDKELKRVAWASEWPFLEHAVRMTPGWELFVDEKGNAYFEVEPDTLYRFKIASLLEGMSIEDIGKAKKGVVKGKEMVAVTYPNTYKSPAPFTPTKKTNGGFSAGQPTTDTEKTFQTGSSLEKIVQLTGTDKKPLANLIPEYKYLSIIKNGCTFCGATIDENSTGVTLYEEDEVVLCRDCSPKDRDEITIYTREENIIRATKST